MSPALLRALGLAWWVLALVGCPPAFPELPTTGSTSSDEGSASTLTLDEDSTSSAVACPQNLLQNGSFEGWTDMRPDAWNDDAMGDLAQVEGIAGSWALRGTFTGTGSLGQLLPPAPAAGTCFQIGLWIRLDAGSTELPARIRINTTAGGSLVEAANFAAILAPIGQWERFDQELCIANAGAQEAMFMIAGDEGQQVELSLDDVSVCLVE